MSQLIEAGLTVTLIGMGTVFVLLTLLVWIVQLMSRFVQLAATDEVVSNPPRKNVSDDDPALTSAISAAVHMFRRRHSGDR